MLALLGIVAVHVLLGPPPAERVAQAIHEVYAEGDVQRELPGSTPKSAERTSADDRSKDEHDSSSWRGHASDGAPAVVGSAAVALLFAVCGVGVALLLAVFVKAVASRAVAARERGGKKAASVVPSAAEPAPPPPLDEADRLASEGRFDEAAHVLLLRAVHAVRVGERGVPRHWTSREVATGAALAAARRDPLGVLIDAVERSLFGGRPLGASDWAAARAASERFHASSGAHP